MDTRIKIGLATGLSLAAWVSHADIPANSSGSSTMILFAEVINNDGETVASYAANTGVSVSAAYDGVADTVFAADANLSALFAADVTGDTLIWAVEGGQYNGSNVPHTQSIAGNTMNVSTAANPAQISAQQGVSLSHQDTVLANAIVQLNSNIDSNGNGTSVEGTSAATAGVWDPESGNNGIWNWNGAGPSSIVVGFGSAQLWDMTGTGTLTSKLNPVTYTSVSLTENGLQFFGPLVPLPAAAWLLLSGLGGLTLFGRTRKAG
jgi:hypothetical protein